MEEPVLPRSSPILKPLGILGQTGVLFKKNLLSKQRQGTKKLIGVINCYIFFFPLTYVSGRELLDCSWDSGRVRTNLIFLNSQEIFIPVLYLGLLSFMVNLQKVQNFEAVTQSYEVPQHVMSSLFQTPSHIGSGVNSIPIQIVPDTTETRQLVKQVDSVWQRYSTAASSQSGTKVSEIPTLSYNFHRSEFDLNNFYHESFSDWNVALILPNEFTIASNYTIRLSPDWVFHLPPLSTLKTGSETCRGGGHVNQGTILSQLETPSTCPVNGYYYANFLAIQSLVQQAILELTGKLVSLTVTVENYPSPASTGGE